MCRLNAVTPARTGPQYRTVAKSRFVCIAYCDIIEVFEAFKKNIGGEVDSLQKKEFLRCQKSSNLCKFYFIESNLLRFFEKAFIRVSAMNIF